VPCALTRRSTRTHKCVRSLRSHLALCAGYLYVMHRRASHFVRSCVPRSPCARCTRRETLVVFNRGACGERLGLGPWWAFKRAAPRDLRCYASSHVAGNIPAKHRREHPSVHVLPYGAAARHPRASFLNRAELASWHRACSKVASALMREVPMHNKAVETDAQVRPRACWRASILVRRSPLR
jgi:hypothetical protein